LRVAWLRLPATAQGLGQLAHVVDDLAYHLAGGFARALGDEAVERQESGHQVDVRLHLPQHLRLAEHLPESQALDRPFCIAGRRREIRADVAQPSRHLG
jgi:hypothetical protein